MLDNYQFTVAERFIKYVQIDTQSNPHSNTHPTTEKQKDLSNILANELIQQIMAGKTETEIRASWQPKLNEYKKIRKKYLLYPDFE